MNYLTVQSYVESIYLFMMNNIFLFAILWIIFLGYCLWRLSKKDNDFVLKGIFKKK
jgi:hypothetical protein